MRRYDAIRQSIMVSFVLMAILFFTPLVIIVPFQTELFSGELPIDETEVGIAEGREMDKKMTLMVLDGGIVQKMNFEEYLTGVVRAEMPASFESEALKAQAVAARTYTMYKVLRGGNHANIADICTDPACCQAYLSENEAKANWGSYADTYQKKVEDAVKATDGQAILYGGVPVLAVFHSSSAGLTRSAGEVWVNDLPYLQAVSSPEVGERIPNYYSRVEFTVDEFCEKIQTAYPEADLSGNVGSWMQNAVVDQAGNVDTLCVGGKTVKGSALRSVLGLRSACFEWEVKADKLVFYVTGYGHGVGLSQYGANQMAADGATYKEILTHYYTGVTVEPYAPDELHFAD